MLRCSEPGKKFLTHSGKNINGVNKMQRETAQLRRIWVRSVSVYDVTGLLNHVLNDLLRFRADFLQGSHGCCRTGATPVSALEDDQSGVGGAISRVSGSTHRGHPGNSPSTLKFDIQCLQTLVAVGPGPDNHRLLGHGPGRVYQEAIVNG